MFFLLESLNSAIESIELPPNASAHPVEYKIGRDPSLICELNYLSVRLKSDQVERHIKCVSRWHATIRLENQTLTLKNDQGKRVEIEQSDQNHDHESSSQTILKVVEKDQAFVLKVGDVLCLTTRIKFKVAMVFFTALLSLFLYGFFRVVWKGVQRESNQASIVRMKPSFQRSNELYVCLNPFVVSLNFLFLPDPSSSWHESCESCESCSCESCESCESC